MKLKAVNDEMIITLQGSKEIQCMQDILCFIDKALCPIEFKRFSALLQDLANELYQNQKEVAEHLLEDLRK